MKSRIRSAPSRGQLLLLGAQLGLRDLPREDDESDNSYISCSSLGIIRSKYGLTSVTPYTKLSLD